MGLLFFDSLTVEFTICWSRALRTAGTRSDEVFQHLAGDSGRVPDEGRGPLQGRRAVPQQHTRRRRHAVQSRPARHARAACTYAPSNGC